MRQRHITSHSPNRSPCMTLLLKVNYANGEILEGRAFMTKRFCYE